jgi:hypothetical protein
MKTLKNVLVLTHRVTIAAALDLARLVKFRRRRTTSCLLSAKSSLNTTPSGCGTQPCRLCPRAGCLARSRCPRQPGDGAGRGQTGA